MYEYLKLGRMFGPVSAADLLQLAETGALEPDDRVRELGELGFRSARDMIALLRTARMAQASQPAPRLSRSSRPAVGGDTVFGSVRPLPPNPAPRLDSRCKHAGNPADARFCGECGAALEP